MKRLLQWFRSTPQTRREPGRRPRSTRLSLEQLEAREVLSVSYLSGAPMLSHVEVETIFLGSDWQTNPQLVQRAQQLNKFFSYITNSTYMDMLAEYSTNQYTIGRGRFEKGIVDPVSMPSSVSKEQIEQELDKLINQGQLAPPDGNRLYFVFTPPGVVVTKGNETSGNSFLGFHSYITDPNWQSMAPYAIIADVPVGQGTWPGITTEFQNLTGTSSHELAEAVTDPDVSTGWINRATGDEIGDLAVGKYGVLGGWVVQAEWSNQANGAILPDGAVPLGSQQHPQQQQVPSNLLTIANRLTHSPEYFSDIVTAAYQKYLGRLPDKQGLNYWVNALQHGWTDELLEASFIGSPEYIANHGGTGEGWVTGMYRDLLGRDPDQAGVKFWVSAVHHGLSTRIVAFGFAASAEREGQRIQADYQRFLSRDATQTEVNYWVRAFVHGTTNEQVIAGFVGSKEYFLSKGQGDPASWVNNAFEDIYNRQPTTDEVNTWVNALN